MSGSFSVSRSTLVAHKLTQLRRETLTLDEYRRLVRHISLLLTYEVTREIQPEERLTFEIHREDLNVPLQATGIFLGSDPVVVPILRSGLVMAEAFQEIMPQTLTGHIGIHRDKRHPKRNLIQYLVSLPDLKGRLLILLDPVIATGDTASHAIQAVKKHGAKDIRFASLIISSKARERLTQEHSDVDFYCAAEDPDVDEVTGRVIPGLGAVSEGLFGYKTKLYQGRQ